MKEIARHLAVSPTTVMRWLRQAGIPSRSAHPSYRFQVVNRIPYKLCKGPLHREGVWIPLDDFIYKYRKPRSQCRDCERVQHNVSALLEYTDLYSTALTAIVNRIGIQEASRRMEISQPTVSKLFKNGKRQKIRRSTAAKILQTAKLLQESGEVIHRDSIKHGASQRGRAIKTPQTWKDFYSRTGDLEKDRDRAKKQNQRALQ